MLVGVGAICADVDANDTIKTGDGMTISNGVKLLTTGGIAGVMTDPNQMMTRSSLSNMVAAATETELPSS